MHQCPDCKARSVSFRQIALAGSASDITCPNCHATLRQEFSARHLAILLPFTAYWLMQHYVRAAGFVNEVLWLIMATGGAFAICSLLVVLKVASKRESA